MNRPLILAIDFDDTIAYKTDDLVPRMFLPFAKEVINWAYKKGCKILIWTCRSTDKRKAVKDFLKANKVKYHRMNKNADHIDFTNSRKIYGDMYIDDKNYGAEIDWLKIKEDIKGKLISKLADEIIETKKSKRQEKITGRVLDVALQGLPKPKCPVGYMWNNEKNKCEKVIGQIASGTNDMPPMSRGKPNSENPDVGMDESQQKMYDGKDRSNKRYDQLGIVTKERDWLDNEEIIEDLVDTRAPHPVGSKKDVNVLLQESNEIDYYYENPKGTGDTIPVNLPVDEEAMKLKLDEKLINHPKKKIKDDEYVRDNTQKYIMPDQKLYNKRYWEEKTEPMKHSV